MSEAADVRDLAAAARMASTGGGRRIREAARVPMQAVADAIGVAGPTLARWETGERRPTGAPAIAWVRLLRDLEDDIARAVGR